MRLIDHTTSPYTGRAAGLPASFGRIARQQPLVPAFASGHAVAAVPQVTEATVPQASRADVNRLPAAAQRTGARQVGELFARGSRALAAAVRALVDAWKRARERHATTLALGRLDRRTLRDLGLDRSELLSVTYDLERDDDTARLRTVRVANGLRFF